ncbi:hypothetical protein DL93DRAFT_2091803 [Clavulina sp. PMI_390]|nr:hypothetical protein DL93DRAFT_2091803 [Clavulina sp. PMI_390]
MSLYASVVPTGRLGYDGFAGIVGGGGGLTTCLAILAIALIVPAYFPCCVNDFTHGALCICLRRLGSLPHGLTRRLDALLTVNTDDYLYWRRRLVVSHADCFVIMLIVGRSS